MKERVTRMWRQLGTRRAAGAATVVILVAAVCVAAAPMRSSGGLLPHDRVIDLRLELDDSAIGSLKASPDEDVRGKLAVDDGTGRENRFDVELRVKGQLGSKRPFDNKPALKMKVLNGSRIFGFERLTLNNMVQDPTLLHEALGYRVYAAAGVAVPETAYARLTVNGQPYGLYLLVETIDRQFLEHRFGNDTGILYEGAYGTDLRTGDEQKFELDEGKDPGREALSRLIRAVETPGDGVFYGQDALVDTPTFLAMMAAGVMIADWDNYYHSNNYRIYWNPEARRWFIIPTGIDQTFVKERTSVFGGHGLLFRKCLESERCTADYIEAVRRVADSFEQLDLPKKMDSLVAMLVPAFQDGSKKPFSSATVEKAREKMRRFILERPGTVRASLPSS